MALRMPCGVIGYVLAGGRSSRMGRNKALLELGGHTLLDHAVRNLLQVCDSVRVLSSCPDLAEYAPLVPDVHPECGPLGGIEAAMLDSHADWNLFLPVDMPFMPSLFLKKWVGRTLAAADSGVKLAMFTVDGVPQPTLLLIHRAFFPFIEQAVQRKAFKLYPVLAAAAEELARLENLPCEAVFHNLCCDSDTVAGDSRTDSFHDDVLRELSDLQKETRRLWFANLNTPEEFAEAQRFAGALDT